MDLKLWITHIVSLKLPPPIGGARFENTTGNPYFFTFLNTNQNAFFFYNRNMDILISNLLSETIFDFGKWANWKYTNTRSCVFSVWPLTEVENLFRKQIWNKIVHISILNFFLEKFRSLFKKVRDRFPIVF